MAASVTVFRGGALGDLIATLPALRALARQHQSVTLVGNRSAALALAPDLFADVRSLDDPTWTGLFDDRAQLPREGGSAMVLLKDPRVAERLRAAEWQPVIALPPFPPPASDRHVAQHLLEGLVPACTSGADLLHRRIVHPSEPARARARDRLDEAGVSERFAVLHPGSGSRWKNWPPERFAATGDRLAEAGLDLVVIGGPADAESAAATHRALRHRAALFADLSLDVLAALLGEATLYVGNDSGVSHLAGGVGAPTLALFGATRAARWAPCGPAVTVLEPARRCELCAQAEERPAPCRCIEQIDVSTVVEGAARVLAERAV